MKICIVIPVYRHAKMLQTVIEQILNFKLDLILVDDGNDAEQKAILEKLAKNHKLTLLSHSQNQGKGAALISGLKHAKAAGFTHFIQIDADAQHQISDIPKFIEAAKSNPDALILGQPIFNKSAPLSRVWGRKLTTCMIWLETMSMQVADGLFGFRLYPIDKSLEIVNSNEVNQRMGFDTEIIVRLVRAGIKVINIPTPVVYPKDGLSNFRYFKDNASLVLMHLRLLFSALMVRNSISNSWSKKTEHGSVLALRMVLVLYRFGGKKLLNLLIYPVVFYYYLKDSYARKSSSEYLERVLGKKGSVLKHFKNFGDKIISSLQAWLGEIHPRDIQWQNRKLVFDLVEQKKGALVISAHFGCLEMTRATHSQEKGLKIIPLMYMKNSQIFRGFLREVNPNAEKEIIYVDSIHPGIAIEIHNRMAKGEFIAILADRIAPNSPDRAVEVDFFGEKARLPEGPFALAMSLGCPVFAFFSFYDEALGKYCANWEKLEFKRPESREERRAEIANSAQLFANTLEKHCRQAPYQWFNFFDFWQQSYKELQEN